MSESASPKSRGPKHTTHRGSLRTKLLIALSGIAVASVSVTSYLGYARARDSLREAIFAHLTSIREARARQIEGYFRTVRNEVSVLGSTRIATEATREFARAIKKIDGPTPTAQDKAAVLDYYHKAYLPKLQEYLGPKATIDEYLPIGAAPYYLQHRYIVNNPHPPGRRQLFDRAEDNSDYNAVHAKYQPLFRRFIEALGYYDLFLVDPETGRVIYSVMKEPDFATSMFHGPYKKTSLASAVMRCKSSPSGGATCLEDYTPYDPSNGAPAAFLSTPVFDDGHMIGMLAVQLSNDAIDRVMTGNRRWQEEGLGRTGETYLVGPDHRLRSTSRFFLEDPESYFKSLESAGAPRDHIDAIRRYGTPILQQEVRAKAVDSALAGLQGTDVISGYRNVPALTSYRPLDLLGVKWVLVAKIDRDEAFAPVTHLLRNLLMISAAVVAVVCIGAIGLTRALLRPLHTLTDAVRAFGEQQTIATVPIQSNDEVGELCGAFNDMARRIQDQTETITRKNEENESLLLNILPEPIAVRLRDGEERIADKFAEVTVLFADIVDFTVLSTHLSPKAVVNMLDGLFTRFDLAAQELGIEKIKTVGDAYMAVCGLPKEGGDHTMRMMNMAVRMIHIAREYSLEHGVTLRLRVGVNCGPVVAGVIGKNKFIYDLWGDTVNIASRMESHGLPDVVQVTRAVFEKLRERFPFEGRGMIEIKGKGKLETWMLKV